MTKKNNKTNPDLKELIHNLKKHANENKVMLWKDIAERFEKPLNNWSVVNLKRINRTINEKETALIAGKVLSDGNLEKKVNIAAWSFSDRAIEKIKKSGGKTYTIEEIMKENPKGKNIRIIG